MLRCSERDGERKGEGPWISASRGKRERSEVDGVDGRAVPDEEGGRGAESQLPVRECRNNAAV